MQQNMQCMWGRRRQPPDDEKRVVKDRERSRERTMNRAYHEAAPQSELWELPDVGHTLGLRDRSAAYERRVTTFLDRALARS